MSPALEQQRKIVVHLRRLLSSEAAMWPFVVVTKPKAFKVVLAELHLIIHRAEESLHLAAGGWTVHMRADVANSFSFAPTIEPTVCAFETIGASIIRENLARTPVRAH